MNEGIISRHSNRLYLSYDSLLVRLHNGVAEQSLFEVMKMVGGGLVSQATPFAERRGSGHAAIIDSHSTIYAATINNLLPWQKLAVTN